MGAGRAAGTTSVTLRGSSAARRVIGTGWVIRRAITRAPQAGHGPRQVTRPGSVRMSTAIPQSGHVPRTANGLQVEAMVLL